MRAAPALDLIAATATLPDKPLLGYLERHVAGHRYQTIQPWVLQRYCNRAIQRTAWRVRNPEPAESEESSLLYVWITDQYHQRHYWKPDGGYIRRELIFILIDARNVRII